MCIDELGLSRRDGERVRKVLGDSERLVLVAKPRGCMRLAAAFPSLLVGAVLAVFLSVGAYMFGDKWWVTVLLFSPFWLVALVFLSSPLRYRWRMGRTLYVLTNRRAIVFEQLRMWRSRCICWPLFPGLIKKVTKEKVDLGSLIFDYEMRYSFDSRKRVPEPVGFLAVPQPDVVQQLVQEQLAAVPAGAAPFAYRPTVLRSPAPLLDAWGTPLSKQPEEAKDDKRTIMTCGAAFVFGATISVAVGLGLLHTEYRLAHEGLRTTATVLRMEGSANSGYFPELQFTDTAGTTHVLKYNISTDNYPKGHRLPIVYLPSDPESLRIVTDSPSPGLIFTLGGGFIMLLGACILRMGIKINCKK
ncbi:MAG: DUF3592 domain-containing protein [Akkermansia sp.]|nr:DUF3592 domain-containing protein [Akkermansia sp.]